jgi:hypothetical protein
MSHKTAVIQHVEPTKLPDSLNDSCLTTVSSNIESTSSRYNLRSRDINQPSAFHQPIAESHVTDEHLDLVSNDIFEQPTSDLATATRCYPRRTLTPPLERNNCVWCVDHVHYNNDKTSFIQIHSF